jgi:hypothetical protein
MSEHEHGTIGEDDDPARDVEDLRDRELQEAQEGKGYGEDEGEREESLTDE